MDDSFLCTEPSNVELCLLCSKKLSRSEARVIHPSGWETLKTKAKEWSRKQVPVRDDYFRFTEVHAKVDGVEKPFGKRHEYCRIHFSSRLSRYSFREETACTNDEQKEDSADIGGACISKRSSRSSTDYLKSFEKKCFVCFEIRGCENKAYNCGGIGRCEKIAASSNIERAMNTFINDIHHKYYLAANRLQHLLSGQSHDAHSADVYYHQSCYRTFVKIPKDGNVTDRPEYEQCVLNDFFTSIQLNILRDENAYLLTQLLDDWTRLCNEKGVSTLITRTNQIRRKIEERFKDDIGFFPSGKCVIVHSAWLNPCTYSVATLRGAGLRDIDLAKGFAAMIKRKVSLEVQTAEFPYKPNDLSEEIYRGPMKDLYNVIYLTIKGSCRINEFGYARTDSRTLATKLWSLAFDWQALITGRENAKQLLMGLILHRMSGSKLLIQHLKRLNHSASYKNIILQNQAWERMVMSESPPTAVIRSDVPLHSGIDNNDGRQETLTGSGTTHHTNSLFFQKEGEIDINAVQISVAAKHPGTKEITPYRMGAKGNSPVFPHFVDDVDSSLLDQRFKEDILWSLVGGIPDDVADNLEMIGSWTAFHRLSSNAEICKSFMEYLPVVPQPPDYDVLREYLDFLIETTDDLSLKRIYCHSDEAVYSKILQIMWRHGEVYKKVIPLMGGFHQLLVLMKIIYKRHGCVGYKKWFVDANTIASGSADKAVEGRHYYRFMRVHKEAFDAIVQTRVEKLTNNYIDVDITLLTALIDLRREPSRSKIDNILQMHEFESLHQTVIATTGTRSQMTLLFLKDISLLLSMVFAAREQNIDLHLQAEREFVNLAHAHDHVNYARYNSYQHVLLSEEKRNNTELYRELSEHGFTASVTGDPFSAVHGDLIVEWFNKQTKGKGGPFRSGYSTKISAVNTFVRTMHIHARLHREMNMMLMIRTSSTHKELSMSSMKRHTAHVMSLKHTISNMYYIDLFSDGPATSLATGEEIENNIVTGILTSSKLGHSCYTQFVEERLVNGTRSFFDPIKKNNVKTGIVKKKEKTKEVRLLSEDRQAFGVIAAKSVSLEEAFQHPITTIPLSIATSETKLYQTDKSKLRKTIIDGAIAKVSSPPLDARWIVDGMAIVRALKPDKTYNDFFRKLLSCLIPKQEYKPKSLEIIMDTYIKYSTKSGTREDRGETGTRIYVTGLGQKMPDTENSWNSLLSTSENKTDLIKLFLVYLKSDEVSKNYSIPITVTAGDETWLMNEDGCHFLFSCNHEEADSRMVLHASLEDTPCVIRSKDTDVLVLLTYGYEKTGHKSNWYMNYDTNAYADIKKVHAYLGSEIASCLPQLHALTGCDTTSYFFRKGKVPVLKKILKHPSSIALIKDLGAETELSTETVQDVMRFIQTVIYSGKDNESYVETRVRLYKEQKKKSSLNIPPDPGSSVQAIKRVHHQVFRWCRCTNTNIANIDFKKNGWKLGPDGTVIPVWYMCSQLPESITRKPKKNYEADVDSDDEYEPPTKRRTRGRTNPKVNSKLQHLQPTDEEENEVTDTSEDAIESEDVEWQHLSAFSTMDDEDSSEDSSDSDWAP